jgi:hypothetical protein
MGGIDFVLKDKQGKEKAKYFDFKTKKINDYFMMNMNGYSTKVNGFGLRNNTEVGLIHLSELRNSATIYNSTGVQIGFIERFFATGDFGILNKEPFISAGVIPVLRKDKEGYTFAVVKK